MDTTIHRFPAVLDFARDVVPLLAAIGIESDDITQPIVISPSYVHYQRLLSSGHSARIIEDLYVGDATPVLTGLGLPPAPPTVVARFDAHGCMKIEIGGIVAGEALVVYSSQPTVGG